MLKYCKECVMPNTKPDLKFDKNGVCSACLSYKNRSKIDWAERKKELKSILDKYKSQNKSNWDCVIPVSGGKDSTYQVLSILKLGYNPLCVTSTTCDLSDIGRRNIENIKNLGVDLIEVSPNPIVRARLNRICLEEVGDISWPEHIGIFTIPVKIAIKFQVPLIIWGENSQNEYGGPASAAENKTLDRAWLEEFGGLLGLRVSDLVQFDGIEQHNLISYSYPSDEELLKSKVTGIFLGYYLPWDGFSNLLHAQASGFETFYKNVEGSMVNYENLDNYQTGIHDYFKFLKFGFGRTTDIACLHLRRGRITRGDALEIVKNLDGKFPWYYLDKSLEDIIEPLQLSLDKFKKICDEFTNKKIFLKKNDGSLFRDKNYNLIKINYDNK